MARIPLLGTVGGMVVMAVTLLAHRWMFASHEHQQKSAGRDVAGTTAAVADAPLPAPWCGSGMAACTAAPTEEPRLPAAVLLSPLPLVLWALRDRLAASRPRPCRSGDDPDPPLSPVTSGVLRGSSAPPAARCRTTTRANKRQGSTECNAQSNEHASED